MPLPTASVSRTAQLNAASRYCRRRHRWCWARRARRGTSSAREPHEERRIVCADGAKSRWRKDPRQAAELAATSPIASSTERDFWGGDRRVIRNVLRAYPASRAAAVFSKSSVSRFTRKQDGKYFPTSNRVAHACSMRSSAHSPNHAPSCTYAAASRAFSAASDGRFVVDSRGRRLIRRADRRARDWRSLASEDGAAMEPATDSRARLVTATSRRRPRWCRSCLADSVHGRLAGVAHPVTVISARRWRSVRFASMGRCSGRISAPAAPSS